MEEEESVDILLVEDNRADAELLKEFLVDQTEALQIHQVKDGYDALDFVFQRKKYETAPRPDVILLDLGLPRITGYEVLRNLKDHPLFSKIPVIILTTSCNPLDRDQCEALGANAFFSKPYDLKGYEDLVSCLLNQEFPRLAGYQAAS